MKASVAHGGTQYAGSAIAAAHAYVKAMSREDAQAQTQRGNPARCMPRVQHGAYATPV